MKEMAVAIARPEERRLVAELDQSVLMEIMSSDWVTFDESKAWEEKRSR